MQNPPLTGEPTEFQEIGYAQVETNPNNPPWNGWVALGVFVSSVVLIIAFTTLFLIPYIVSSDVRGLGNSELEKFVTTDPIAVFLQIIGVIPAHIVTFLLCWFVVTNGRKFSFRDTLGWRMNGFRVWHAVIITVCFYALSIIAILTFGKIENSFDQMLSSSRWIIIPVAILAVFTAPIVEEVVYRGIMFSAWQRKFGTIVATALVTILFTVVHGAQYSQGSKPDIATLSVLFLLSLTLTVIRAKTDNLLPSIVLHITFNGFQSVLMLLGTILSFFEPGITPTSDAILFPK